MAKMNHAQRRIPIFKEASVITWTRASPRVLGALTKNCVWGPLIDKRKGVGEPEIITGPQTNVLFVYWVRLAPTWTVWLSVCKCNCTSFSW